MRSVLFLTICLPLAAQSAPSLTVVGTTRPEFAIAAVLVRDLTGDGREEILILGERGEIRILDPNTGKLNGSLILPHPQRSLVTVARLDQSELIVFSPDGMQAYAMGPDGFAGPPRRLLRRARFTLRVGRPQFADLAQDVNGDGRTDLIVPSNTACTLYLNQPDAATKRAKFLFASKLELRITSRATTRAEPLSSELDHHISIPNLRTIDVNGDGRGDLVVTAGERRLYHLQRADGVFPAKPDIILDLTHFRDTTPRAQIEFGQTLAEENTLFHTQDLNGDNIPDYIIAHRRKVWVYHGTTQGPQFDHPSKILILAEDVTFLLLMHLDDDEFPDLLVFKLQVPSLATLFLGLFASWDVKIKSVGYANDGGKTFERTPKWRSETIIRVPSIMSLIRNPEAIVERFSDVGRKFRHALTGDLNGDAIPDVLLQTEDKSTLQFWLMDKPEAGDRKSSDRRFRALLFEDEDQVWDVERILGLIRSMADDRTARMTLGRPAAGTHPLRDPEKYRLEFATAADLDGDGRDEIVLHYISLVSPFRSTIDILRLRP